MKVSEERIEKIIEEIEDSIVIVEGKKDEKVLKAFGIRNIIKINGRPLIKIVDKVIDLKVRYKEKQVVILTDFDPEGKKIASRLKSLLQKHKIHPNTRLRRDVMKIGKTHIEGLKGIQISWFKPYKKYKEDDYHVKTRTYYNKISYKGKDKGKGCNRKA